MEETAQPTTSGGYNKRPLWQWIVIYLIFGVIIYGAVYYFFLNKNNGYNDSKSSTQYSSPTPQAMSKDVTVVLKPVNDSGEVGTAILSSENGVTKITISLTGYAEDIEQPAHIHIGECPGVGAVKYPLTPIVNGVSETLLDLTLESLKKELPLAINVHKSATEASVYTACGPLAIE